MAHKISVLLAQAESSWSVSTVLLASGILGLMGFSIARFWLVDLIPGLIAGVLAAALPILVLRAKGARRLRKFNQKLPDALDLMARALRAGHSVGAAIEIVAQEGGEPLRSEFGEVYKQQSFGLPQRDALLQLGRRVPSADLQIVITAMLVQKETGGNLVEILERTTAVLRDRMRIQGELRVRTAQGRLTGWILCLLPVVMFFLHKPCQSRLRRRPGARSGGAKAHLCRHWHDGAGRIDDPQNRQDQGVSHDICTDSQPAVDRLLRYRAGMCLVHDAADLSRQACLRDDPLTAGAG